MQRVQELAQELGHAGFRAAVLYQDDYFVRPPRTNHEFRLLDIHANVGPQEVQLDLIAEHIAAFRAGRDVVAPLVDYPGNRFVTQPLALSVWSAAASFGDEACSLAMLLSDLQRGGQLGSDWRVLGTDISDRVLRSASYCDGMKTGYTEAAGYCLVATGERNGRRRNRRGRGGRDRDEARGAEGTAGETPVSAEGEAAAEAAEHTLREGITLE